MNPQFKFHVSESTMTDTPQHIKSLQLKIWLSKSPMERLKQMMEDNASLFNFWANTKRIDSSKINDNAINVNEELGPKKPSA